jgi:hypothetical protein
LRSTARWGLAAGLGGAVGWVFIGVPAVLLGLVGIVLGFQAARPTRRGTTEWWIGVVAAMLGAIPLAALALYFSAALMGWGDFGR